MRLDRSGVTVHEWIRRFLFTLRLNGYVVDPMGPVFLSYRQRDGRGLAIANNG